jgi:predicted MFS family arabinose efflux permease
LGLSDTQLGLLSGLSFALFYALAAFPIARKADVGDRSRIVAICVIIWSAATAFCGLASSFWQMLLARIGLAAGEAGAGPATSSLLIEIFPAERRTLIIASLLAATSIGVSGGLALAGYLSQYFGWREIFLLLGLPGIALGVIVWIFCAEPRRHMADAAAAPKRQAVLPLLRHFATIPSLRWSALVLMTVPITGFALIIWGASFFQRVHGLDKAETGLWLGGAMAAGLVIGNLFAGWMADRYGVNRPRFNGWFAGVGLLIAFPAALLFALTAHAYVALACFVVVKFMMTLHLGPILSICHSQIQADQRATFTAATNMIIGLAGTGVGGTLAGMLSSYFTRDYGVLSLQPALAVLAIFLLVGGVASVMAGIRARPAIS